MSTPSPLPNSSGNTGKKEDSLQRENASLTDTQVADLKAFYDKISDLNKQRMVITQTLNQRNAAIQRIQEQIANDTLSTTETTIADILSTLQKESEALKANLETIDVKIGKEKQQLMEYQARLLKPSAPESPTAKTPNSPIRASKQPTDTPIVNRQTSSADSSQGQASDNHPSLRATALMNETPPIPTKSQKNISSLSITTPETSSKNEMEIINERLRINKVMECINNGRRKITGINNQTKTKALIGTKEFPVNNIIQNNDGGYIVESITTQDNAKATAPLSNAAFNLLLNEQLKFEIDKNKVDITKLQSKVSAIQQEIKFREQQQDVSKLITIEKIILARQYLRSKGIEMTYEVIDAGTRNHDQLNEKNYQVTLNDSAGNIQTKYFSKDELDSYAAHQVQTELDVLQKELEVHNKKILYKTAEHRDALLMRLKTVDQDLENLNKEKTLVNPVNRDEFDDLLESHHAEKISKSHTEFEQIKTDFKQASKDIDNNPVQQTSGIPQKAIITKLQKAQPQTAYETYVGPRQGIITHADGNIIGARQSTSITRTFTDTTLLDAIGSAVKTFANSRDINKPVAINLSQKEITITSYDPRKDINFKATTTSVSTDKTTDKNLQAMSVALVENLRFRLDADTTAINLSIQLGECRPHDIAVKFTKCINLQLDKLKSVRSDLADRIKNVPEPTTPNTSVNIENSIPERSRSPGSSSSLN